MNPFALAAGAICVAAGFGMPCTASTDKQASPRSSAQANAALSGSTSGEASSVHVKAKAKKPGQPTVSEASARRIAWRSGVDHIEEIILSGERWEVAGRDRIGNEKALDIHAYDGSVLN